MEFVLVVIVGLLSGALGSVAGPLITHRLARRERREQRGEKRHADLRVMLEEKINEVWLLGLGAVLVWVRTTLTKPAVVPDAPLQEHNERIADLRSRRQHPWLPYRIDDDDLKDLARALEGLGERIEGHLRLIPKGATKDDVERWWAEAPSFSEEWTELPRKIYLRLDELGW